MSSGGDSGVPPGALSALLRDLVSVPGAGDVETGRRVAWKALRPLDPAALRHDRLLAEAERLFATANATRAQT